MASVIIIINNTIFIFIYLYLSFYQYLCHNCSPLWQIWPIWGGLYSSNCSQDPPPHQKKDLLLPLHQMSSESPHQVAFALLIYFKS